MPGTPKDAPASPNALDLVLRWLGRAPGDQPALEELLAELAAGFAAPAAGIGSLPDGSPLARYPSRDAAATPKLPWADDPGLLARRRESVLAVSVPLSAGGGLLFTTFGGPDGSGWVLWLEDPRRDGWDDTEATALELVGLVLGRWLRVDRQLSRWAEQLDRAARQQHLEIAAQCARRLAHDFGNVLTGIQGFTELALAQQAAATGPLRSYLDEVYRGAQSGAQFTHQLRLFSRRQSASSSWCALRQVLAEEQAQLRPACEAGLTLQVSVPDDLPGLALDAEHMQQVLAALLENARDALAGPGSVSVSARPVELTASECSDLFGAARPGRHVEICIADTGVGLGPEAQRRLFAEPFFTTKPGRRGFGLAVAYGILCAHGGGLRLHAGERGVVARVLVPVAPDPPTAAASGEARGSTVRGEKVLVVDDEPAVLRMIGITLERAGYRVQAVGTAEDALRTYAAQAQDPFGLVVSDVVMPRTTGVELARRLLKRDANVRVLFLSGQVSTDFSLQEFAGKKFDLLTKPFTQDGLLRAVRAVLDRPTARGSAPRGPRPSPAVRLAPNGD